jgi:hypothetical protein
MAHNAEFHRTRRKLFIYLFISDKGQLAATNISREVKIK